VALFLPQRWRQQPQYPVRIATEWAPSAVFALNAAVPVEIVNGFSYGASPWTRIINGHGRALENVGNSAILTTNSDLVLPVGSACTILMQAYKTAESAAAPALATATFPGDGDNANIYLPYSGDGNVYWRWGPGEVAGTGSLAVGGLSFDPRDLWAFTTGPRGMEVWQNGALVGSNSGTPSRSSGGIVVSLGIGNGVGYAQIRLSMLATFNQQMPTAFLRQRQYWGIFAPQRTPRYFLATVTSISGTASITLGALTSSATGTVAIAGTSSVTLGAVTASAAGTLALSGSAAVTLGAVTSSAAGTLAIAGASAVTLGALTSSATGTLALSGTLAVTLGAVTLSASGGSQATGDLAVTLGAATLSATGTLPLSASAAITLAPLTATATGALALAGSFSGTLGALTSAATGALANTGALAKTLGALTLSAAGAAGTGFVATERIYTITAESRRMNVSAENRTHTPNAESRTLIA
jgi:hypothetical protein